MGKTRHFVLLSILSCIVFTAASKKCTNFHCDNSPLVANKWVELSDDTGPIPIVELIRQSGYPVETHEIQTEDGYLLTYHRIPYGKNDSINQTSARPPVLLQHGLLSCSSVWLMSRHGLGFLLADAGFDVWLGNARGNTYSRKHIKYDPDRDKEQFWNFSWHEMGVYDLPAAIDYILRNTSDRSDQLSYIGHSMGTTMYFVMGSMRPEYMRKVNTMVALAPVAYLWHVRSPIIKFLLYAKSILYWMAHKYGCYSLFENSYKTYWADHYVCNSRWLQFICVDFISEVAGFDQQEFDLKHLPLELDYVPAGSSFKIIQHYQQVIQNGFNQFDYGASENTRKYGTGNAPAYNLSSVDSPMYVWWAQNDYLAVPQPFQADSFLMEIQSVQITLAHLPNVKRAKKVPDEDFSHLDFMWAVDANTLVYEDVIATLKNLE